MGESKGTRIEGNNDKFLLLIGRFSLSLHGGRNGICWVRNITLPSRAGLLRPLLLNTKKETEYMNVIFISIIQGIRGRIGLLNNASRVHTYWWHPHKHSHNKNIVEYYSNCSDLQFSWYCDLYSLKGVWSYSIYTITETLFWASIILFKLLDHACFYYYSHVYSWLNNVSLYTLLKFAEPMLTIGSINPIMWDDNWTVVTEDGSLSAQFEHTILITENGAEILTQCWMCHCTYTSPIPFGE